MTRADLLAQGYLPAGLASHVPEVLPRKVVLKERAILLCRADGTGTLRAVDELCPHKQESMAFGIVHEGKIICPHHQYTFDLETGRSSMRRCAPLQTYEVAQLDDEVFVKVP